MAFYTCRTDCELASFANDDLVFSSICEQYLEYVHYVLLCDNMRLICRDVVRGLARDMPMVLLFAG